MPSSRPFFFSRSPRGPLGRRPLPKNPRIHLTTFQPRWPFQFIKKKKKKKFQELQPPVSIPSSSYHRTLLFSTSSKHPSTQDSPHIVLLQKLAALPGLGHFLTSPPRTIIPAIRSRLYVKPFFFLLFLSVAVLCYLFFLSQEMALARAR